MIDFKLGNTTPQTIKFGSENVEAIYAGSIRVWPSIFVGCPPYYCSTNVDPTGCTDLSYAWANCHSIISFPTLDLNSGTNFFAAWRDCINLTSFPLSYFDSCLGVNFEDAWKNCALDQTSVDGILVSLDTAGQSNGIVDLSGGTSALPGATGLSAKDSLEAKGWTVIVNVLTCDYPPYYCATNVNPYCVTNFYRAWYNCTNIATFPLLDMGNGTNFQQTWYNCSNLSYLPQLNVSQGTNFDRTWFNCSSLTTFPALNLNQGTNFYAAWYNCSSLTTFPAHMFDTCLSTSFSNAWYGCALNQASVDNILVSLDLAGQSNGQVAICNSYSPWQNDCSPTPGSSPPGIAGQNAAESLIAKGWSVYLNGWVAPSPPPYYCNPQVNTKGQTDLTGAWSNCYGLNSCFPPLDMTSCTNFENTWLYCSSMQSYPFFDFSNGTNFKGTWSLNGALLSFRSDYDLSNGVDFTECWYSCASLTSFPLLDFSSAINMAGAWRGCSSLTTFPALDLSNATTFVRTWGPSGTALSGIETFELVDVSGGVDFERAWQQCYALTSFAALDFSNGQNFRAAWAQCNSLVTFPAVTFPAGTNFNTAWADCTSLTTFPANAFDTCTASDFELAWYNCALDQTSVDNILVSLKVSEVRNGILSIDGGTSASPSVVGWEAVAYLTCRGWTVAVNGSIPYGPVSIPQNIIDANPGIQVKWYKLTCRINDVETLDPVPPNYYYIYNEVVGATGTSFTPTITEIAMQGIARYTTDGSTPSLTNGTTYGPFEYSCSVGNAAADICRTGNIDTYCYRSYGPYFTDGTTFIYGGPGGPKQAIWQMALTEPNGSLSSAQTEISGWDPAWLVTGPPFGLWGDAVGGACLLPVCNEPYGCIISEDPPPSITDFYRYWFNCTNLTAFPLLNVNNGINFTNAWGSCSMTSMAALNLSNGTNFSYAWKECQGLTTFPSATFGAPATFYQAWTQCNNLVTMSPINLSNGTDFFAAWNACFNLTTFPPNAFDTCTATNFDLAWRYCPLTETSVNNILVSLDTAGQSNGVAYIDGSPPSGAGITSKANLISRGWTVITA